MLEFSAKYSSFFTMFFGLLITLFNIGIGWLVLSVKLKKDQEYLKQSIADSFKRIEKLEQAREADYRQFHEDLQHALEVQQTNICRKVSQLRDEIFRNCEIHLKTRRN